MTKFGDRHVYAGRTRFIPASLLHLFEMKSWPAIEPTVADCAGTAQDQIVDMRARIKAMLLAK
jgi:DNA helicase-2/ATP-dependent DNA helicase PcrA